jgi:hypothetical protein
MRQEHPLSQQNHTSALKLGSRGLRTRQPCFVRGLSQEVAVAQSKIMFTCPQESVTTQTNKEITNEPDKRNVELDLSSLAALRDELRVQAHLFDAELKDQWEKLEKDWHLIQSEMDHLKPVAERAAYRSVMAARPLLSKVKRALDHIRTGLERNHRSKQA